MFAEHGYGAVSVRDIVRRTDLASGTFYNYFPDKDAIFRALVMDAGEEARRRVRAARRRARTAQEFVEGAYRAFFEFIVEDPEWFAFMRRNLETLRDAVRRRRAPGEHGRAGGGPALLRSPPATCRRSTSTTAPTRWSRSALELGTRLVERDPPDVDGATRFAAALFLGALGTLSA